MVASACYPQEIKRTHCIVVGWTAGPFELFLLMFDYFLAIKKSFELFIDGCWTICTRYWTI
jgi:hypothetical protein